MMKRWMMVSVFLALVSVISGCGNQVPEEGKSLTIWDLRVEESPSVEIHPTGRFSFVCSSMLEVTLNGGRDWLNSDEVSSWYWLIIDESPETGVRCANSQDAQFVITYDGPNPLEGVKYDLEGPVKFVATFRKSGDRYFSLPTPRRLAGYFPLGDEVISIMVRPE